MGPLRVLRLIFSGYHRLPCFFHPSPTLPAGSAACPSPRYHQLCQARRWCCGTRPSFSSEDQLRSFRSLPSQHAAACWECPGKGKCCIMCIYIYCGQYIDMMILYIIGCLINLKSSIHLEMIPLVDHNSSDRRMITAETFGSKDNGFQVITHFHRTYICGPISMSMDHFTLLTKNHTVFVG
jgi:hypothetical protein